jgi:hypothetical protein
MMVNRMMKLKLPNWTDKYGEVGAYLEALEHDPRK